MSFVKRFGGWFGFAAGALLALVLLFSAYAKAIDPVGFEGFIQQKGLMPAGVAYFGGIVVIAVEFALGLALLLGVRRPVVLVPALLLMTLFLGMTTKDYFFPPKEASSCGCFGNLVQQTPAQAVQRDLILVGLAALAFLGRPAQLVSLWRWVVPIFGLVSAAGFAIAAPALPIDHWATQLVVGKTIAELKIDTVLPELQEGRHVVLLIDRADEATRAATSRINERLALVAPAGHVWGLAKDDKDLSNEFQWTAGPAFDVRDVPQGLLKPMYRSLPRVALFENGAVKEIWNGMPDDELLGRLAQELELP